MLLSVRCYSCTVNIVPGMSSLRSIVTNRLCFIVNLVTQKIYFFKNLFAKKALSASLQRCCIPDFLLMMYTLYLIVYDTGWFMTCGHYWRSWFPRSLQSKWSISVWVIFSVVMELRLFFATNALLWTTHCSYFTRPWTSWNRDSQQKLQRELWLAVAIA